MTIISGQGDFAALAGHVSDEEAIKAALPAAELAADVLDDFLGARSSAEPDLVDYWPNPATRFFMNTPEGANIIERRPALLDWWKQMEGTKPVLQTYRTVAASSS